MRFSKKALAILLAAGMMVGSMTAGVSADNVSAVVDTVEMVAANPSASKKDIGTATVTTTNFTYDGKSHTTKLTVKVGGKTLVEGVDYKVTGDTHTNAATFTVKITGIGRYEGTKSAKWIINRSALSAEDVFATTPTFSGKKQAPKVIVTVNGTKLVNGKDFEIVDLSSQVDAGTYSFKVVGKGNYKGTGSKVWRIKKLDISKLSIDQIRTIKRSSDGKYIPRVDMKGPSGAALGAKSIAVKFTAKSKKGFKTRITVTGIGNYTGTLQPIWKF